MTKIRRQRDVKPEVDAPLAKVTRPILSAVYPRTRLFRLLDRARQRPIVWVSAPAGSGKTTLVESYLQDRKLSALWYQLDAGDNDIASFFYYMGLAAKAAAPQRRGSLPLLTREFRAGLSVFTANYFRRLFARLKRASVVVLENYQEVAADAGIQQLLHLGLEQIPSTITVVVVSREAPPGAFAGFREKGRIALLDWDELKLTEQESMGIVRLRRQKSPFTRAAIGRLHQDTQGWVAGLVLLAESAEQGLSDHMRPGALSSRSIFDYFASEILRRADPDTQAFLLKTAFLPTIAVSIAQALTERNNARALLDSLTLRNFFTVRHADGSYAYHPLFREFLTSRAAASYTDDEIKKLKQRSAQLLAASGDVETAIALLQQAQDWYAAQQLVLRHGRTLIAQGRIQTVEAWLRNFPDDFRSQNPWVLYFLGVCRVAFAPLEARRYLEQAFALFERQTDAAPLYLTWSKIVDSFLLELDDFRPMRQWLDRYPTLKGDRTPPAPQVENASVFTYVAGLINTGFDHPDLKAYVERAECLYHSEISINRRLVQDAALISYQAWKGEVIKMGVLLERLAPRIGEPDSSSLARLNWYMWKALYTARIGAAVDSLSAVTEGLALAEASGIHVVNLQLLGFGVWGQLCVGDVANARMLLNRMSLVEHHGQIREALYGCHVAMVALHEGDIPRAIDESRRAARLAVASGQFVGSVSYFIQLAYLYAHQGDTDSALDALAVAQPKAIGMESQTFISYCSLCEANIRRLRGEATLALGALRNALSLAQQGGFVTPAYCPRDTAAILYAAALDADIEPEYVRATIAKTGLTAPPGHVSASWPWGVRIRTLGRFEVLKCDQALSVRAHQKVFELLRALIALGGRDVEVAKLAQSLRSAVGGANAHATFRSALLSANRLLGDQILLVEADHVSLNRKRCWVDVWAFEHVIDQLSSTRASDAEPQLLFELYGGAFLAGDMTPRAAVQRERLRAKFVQAALRLIEARARADTTEGISWYEKAIAVEPLVEEFYLAFMRHYARSDRRNDAVAIYQRCCKALAVGLHRNPTGEITTFYKEIQHSLTGIPG